MNATQTVCSECGATVNRVYQYQLCRDCLTKSVQNLRPIINYYRDPDNFLEDDKR